MSNYFYQNQYVSIIGAGKISYSIANLFLQNKIKILSIISRSKESADKLAAKFKINISSNNYNDLDKNTSIFILAVPDNEIETIAEHLAKQNINFKESLFIHLSGAQDISLLKALKDKGAAIASIHFMQTFPTKEIVDLKSEYVVIETDEDEVFNFLFELSVRFNLKPLKLNSSEKTLYHLSGVFACNFLLSNLYLAELTYKDLSISENIPMFRYMDNIITNTLKNAKENGAANSISGPIVRGDLDTIKKHIEVMQKPEYKNSNIIEMYIVQSEMLLKILEQKNKGLTESQKNIRDYLISIK
ncbi:MAG TPA: F420-dependent NADP oxidoreductase [Ignavibacteriaceae bacterium]|nr:F420-dependent NADP oxidoreductase [Ignavibacteriaceae bacterium]